MRKLIFTSKGFRNFITVEIQFDSSIFDKYESLVNNPVTIACNGEVERIDRFVVRHWLHSLLESLAAKTLDEGRDFRRNLQGRRDAR